MNQKILIVEDDPNWQRSLRDTLIKAGYAVEAAWDGTEAVKLLESASEQGHPFQLVTADIGLPEPGGEPQSKEGKRLLELVGTKFPETRVIIVSGTQEGDFTRDELAKAQADYGVQFFFSKARFERTKFLDRVSQIMAYARSTEGIRILTDKRLRALTKQRGWIILCIGITNLDAFVYKDRTDLIELAKQALDEIITRVGTTDDFVGYIDPGIFVVITQAERVNGLQEAIAREFTNRTQKLYQLGVRPVIAFGTVGQTDIVGDMPQLHLAIIGAVSSAS